MLKTILPRITHHLICQCKNPNNKSERLSLLMFILHQEGSFFYYPFFTDLFIVFLEYTYSINRFLLCSNTSSIICVQIFAVTDMSECPTQRLQMRQICRNIFSSSLLFDSLRKQSIIGKQGVIEQQNATIIFFA